MKILYDHQMFSIQKYGGVTKYFCELIKNIPSEDEFQLSVIFSYNHYLREDSEIFKKINVPIPDGQFKGKGFLKKVLYLINQSYSSRIISLNNYDLLHPTFYDTYFLGSLKKPYIITVHDLIAFKDNFYKHSSLRTQMKKVIKNATRIISISENTKKDIVDILNIHPEKIDVIYHGYNKPKANNNINPYGRYILYVGRRGGYKNFITFAKAISGLLNKESALKLICVGEPFNKEEISDFKLLNISRQTIALTVTENLLNSLYSNALVFVFPSLYEGFGMPIIEAFANNCPVCLSNTGSLPEIAEDAAVYFDPYDKESILNAIERVIYNNNFSQEIIKRGKARLTYFSWEKTAEQTINSYKKTLV